MAGKRMVVVKGLREFDLALDKAVDQLGIDFMTVMRKLTFDIFAGVVQLTPVDTGRARSSWNVAVNYIDGTVPPPQENTRGLHVGAKVTGEENAKPGAALASMPDPFQFINISSNLEYIGYLDEGSSDQAPQGMVIRTVERVVRQTNAELRRL